MKTKIFSGIIMGLLLIASPAYAQVTIGEQKPPQSFSVLELISNAQRGLRLPQLTSDERDAITTAAFKANDKAEGLTIFNTTTKCVETWNGTIWINRCEGTPADPRDLYPQDKSGNYILSGKVCYDAYVTDWNTGENNCLPLNARTDAFANGYSFTYKFIGSATFNDLTFEVIDPNRLVASKSPSGSDLTLTFSSDVKTKAKGTTKDNPLKVVVVAVFKDNTGKVEQIALDIAVQDCACGCAIQTGTNTWLTFMCYNLGVPESTKSLTPLEQSNTFSTAVIADLPNDSTIYGAWYQWGRKTDGHQMRNSLTYSGPLDASVAGNLDANGQVLLPAAYGKFITTSAATGALVVWRTNPVDPTLWDSSCPGVAPALPQNPVKSVNDPCPAGWRVPTYDEWAAVRAANNVYYTTTWIAAAAGKTPGMLFTPVGGSQPTLFLPAGGFRTGTGSYSTANPAGRYWSSYGTIGSNNYGYTFQVGSGSSYPEIGGATYQVHGNPVRCIAE